MQPMGTGGNYSVSQLLKRLEDLFRRTGDLHNISVRGEISGFSAKGKHCYFKLKDDTSSIKCAFFYFASVMAKAKSQYFPKDGDEVIVNGYIGIYKQSGEMQLYVEGIRLFGIGNLYAAFENLKIKLQNEGLFDQSRKKEIPFFPKTIGVVTSRTGAVIHDICTTLQKRCPSIKVLLADALVQGNDAPASLIKALHSLEKRQDVEVIIIGRGGGSYEDLFCFNDEKLARAVAACHKPIISAVGHESDFTICDFAADYRAATPTAAAVKASPLASELMRDAQDLCHKIQSKLTIIMSSRRQELNNFAHRLKMRSPQHRLEEARLTLSELKNRLSNALQRKMKQEKERLQDIKAKPVLISPLRIISGKIQELSFISSRLCDPQKRILAPRKQELSSIKEKLGALSPLKVLSRGYSIVSDRKGHAIRTLAELAKEKRICITVSDGKADAEIKQYHINKQ
ncbi:MAG: exodeoxyribonuclease VII large subunit [bacterium]|nr:exodeoxyribonuclease VII large subunit [bacterium]